ncbi:DUF11 domain-containing protein [Deinococcus sp.]|uniref:DUF11 domain-containing protein n=1 Tax=Deinococcus sp. TaxID=47478 RepID=UPI0025E88850|nr:DUF11 domain-containing protein [Deinococcus sp.]
MKHLIRPARSLSALVVLTLSALAQAAGSPAGTVITNQAAASGTLGDDNTPVSGLSNIVSTTVSPVCSVSVTPGGTIQAPGQQQTILAGESALFAYQVTNSGNTGDATPLSLQVPGVSSFTPTLTLYLDANGDGKLDANELTPITSVKLAPDGVAKLLVKAQTSQGQSGGAYINLIAGCGNGQPGDSNNIALLNLGAPPVLSVSKTFSPSFVKPGGSTTVNLLATNAGRGESREVILTDELAALSAQGLNYVPGSAAASGGVLESGSGSSWQPGDAAGAQGLRVRAPLLKPGQNLSLTFKMVTTLGSENQTISNTAVASTPGQSVSTTATLTSRFSPNVALGPVGVPEAPEGSDADSQTRPFALVGRKICFTQTIKNTGDVADSFTLSSTVLGNGAANPGDVTYQTAEGQPLTQPLTLEEGASRDVLVCVTPSQTGSLTLKLLISGARGSQNTTLDKVTLVEAGLPGAVKAVTPVGLVAANTELSYSLTVRNTYSVPLTNVVIRDPLSAALSFTSGSDGATFENGAVVWKLASLAPGESRTLSFKASVKPGTADGTDVTNIFTVSSSELPDGVPSNETSSPVWTSKLVIDKAVSNPEATYGDRLTYTLTVRNLSPKAPLLDGVITDSPAPGLEYIPGTSTLAGVPIADPTITGGKLSWTIATLPPASNVVLTYALRVTTRTSAELPNTVVVSGRAVAGQQATAIASNVAKATVKLRLLTFAPLSEIVGMVYIDRNRDGRFQQGIDQPIERARILLAGGREVLTDAAGRYRFKDVPQGAVALRLDPASVPSPALSLPMDGALSGTRSLNLIDLSAVDFPLAPLTGNIEALRSVNLVAGPLSLSKTVTVSNQSYTVSIRLKAASALPGFELTDPLPVGAVLKEGRNSLSTTLSAGDTTLTYRFDWAGERRAAVTEPELRWRY